MKIQRIKVKNFRNIPDQEIEANGHNLIFYGDNTVGKSNLIRAIHCVLNAQFGGNNISHGKDKMEIELVLAEFNEWTPVEGSEHFFRAVIKRKKNSNEEGKLEIELKYPDGGVEQLVTNIRSFVGTVPLQFNFVQMSRTKKGKDEQLEIVRSYYSDEFKNTLRLQENRGKSKYNERTEVGQQLKAVKGFIDEAGITPLMIDTYSKPFPEEIVKLNADRDKIISDNKKFSEVDERINERKEKIKIIDSEIKLCNDGEISFLDYNALSSDSSATRMSAFNAVWKIGKEAIWATLRQSMIHIYDEQKNQLNELNLQAEKWKKDFPFVPLGAIDKKITDATEHNRIYERVNMFDKKIKEREELEKQYGELDVLVNTIDAEIKDLIRTSPSPIPGLSFDDQQIYYKGKPVDEENMSTAEIMMLEIELQMNKAKNGQILFIERGESLGTDLLEELKQLADGSGFQVIREEVERGNKELLVVVEVENGNV